MALDNLNVLFLTPLPGTRLWDQMKSQGRIPLDTFPHDWKYYTLTYPVAQYKHLSLDNIIREMTSCNEAFYSVPRIFRRVCKQLLASSQAVDQSGGQSLLPGQPPPGRRGIRELQASMGR